MLCHPQNAAKDASTTVKHVGLALISTLKINVKVTQLNGKNAFHVNRTLQEHFTENQGGA